MGQRLGQALGLLFLGLILAFSGVSDVAAAVKNPQTYVYAGFGDVDTLDYAVAYDGGSGLVIANIYETLIDFEGVHLDRFVPLLTTAVPTVRNGLISPDGRTYTFPIRQGVRFHDGTPMTTEDVAYSLRRFLLIGGPPSPLLLEPILGLYHIGDQQGRLAFTFAELQRAVRVQGQNVIVTLKEPFGTFLSIVAGWSFVVSRRWARANGDWDGTAATMARYANAPKESTAFFERANGTGPFKLERWDRPGRQIVLARHDAYWRTPARLARVVLQTVPEAATRVLMLKAGDADAISLSRRELPLVEDAPGVRIVDDLPDPAFMPAVLWFVMDVETAGSPYVGSGWLDGNGIPGNFFADVHVRRGFGFAFDYQTFIADAFRGKAITARGMFTPGMMGYRPRQEYFTFDREKAIAEFKAAWGGTVWERGFRLTVVHGAGAAAREVGARILKDGIESLNPKFRVDIHSLISSTFLGELGRHRIPVFLSPFLADYPDPHNFAFNFLHSQSMRIQRYQTPADVDRLIIDALREPDPRKRESLYVEVNRKYFELAPSIAMATAVSFRVQRDWVRGWYWNPIRFDRFYDIWKG